MDATDSHRDQDSQEEQDNQASCFAVIISNPVSGFVPHQTGRLHDTLAFMRSHGWRAELWFTHGPGHGSELACKAVEQHADMVIAAGGDGTINDIIQGLVGSESVKDTVTT